MGAGAAAFFAGILKFVDQDLEQVNSREAVDNNNQATEYSNSGSNAER